MYRAATIGGVENVLLTAPTADVVATDTQIPYLSGLTINTEILL
jgi:hypothetical protein